MELKVFVIEDNATIQENLASTLEELTCVKVIGASATEDDGLAWLEKHGNLWDMIIVDLFLRGGSGVRLVERVKRQHLNQKVIVFSNYINANVRMKCAQLGVDAVFDKSTEIDSLVDYCAHQCARHAANV